MSDHLIKCDDCGMLMYPGGAEHLHHECREAPKPAPAAEGLPEMIWVSETIPGSYHRNAFDEPTEKCEPFVPQELLRLARAEGRAEAFEEAWRDAAAEFEEAFGQIKSADDRELIREYMEYCTLVSEQYAKGAAASRSGEGEKL